MGALVWCAREILGASEDLGMQHRLIALLGKIAELHGRASEIGARVRQETENFAAVDRELSVVWADAWAVLNCPEPAPIQPSSTGPRMLRLAEVSKRVGLARSSVWKMVKEGRFPVPRRLSQRAVGWLEVEIDAWVTAREALNTIVRSGYRGRRRPSEP
jgi:prophage regulatory protein